MDIQKLLDAFALMFMSEEERRKEWRREQMLGKTLTHEEAERNQLLDAIDQGRYHALTNMAYTKFDEFVKRQPINERAYWEYQGEVPDFISELLEARSDLGASPFHTRRPKRWEYGPWPSENLHGRDK